ncbi:MAG: hypothetical protein ACYDAR_00760, partial [Thermomicrobiales bacterium]
MRSHHSHRIIPAIIVGAALLIAALGSSASVGATVPITNGVPCGNALAVCQPGPYDGYAGSGTTYADPRYCVGGLVSVVTDPQYGELIDVCSSTGQRIFPVSSGTSAYAMPFSGAAAPVNGYRYTHSRCTLSTCVLPANGSGTIVGDIYYYNDSRFCSDGKISLTLSTGQYFCSSTGQPVFR